MHQVHNSTMKNVASGKFTALPTPRFGLIVSLLLAAGALLTWWTVMRVDREMRADLLQQTHLVAQALTVERVKALAGSEADLGRHERLRIKQQLAVTCAATQGCRSLYLMGRKASGEIFFLVDSTAVDVAHSASPGQVHDEGTDSEHRRVFSTREATVKGPSIDHQGTRLTALVPINDPQTAIAGLATPDDAVGIVRQALDFYRKKGRERLLQEVNNPQGAFRQGDLYAFVYDLNMTMLAHPVKPELVGQNLLDQKDWAGGKYFRREIQQVALSKGSGWVDYENENPVNKQHEPKTTYIELCDDLIFCAGSYKGTGGILAVLGMDIDARDWNGKLGRAALPPLLLTVALAAIVSLGRAFYVRRIRSPDASSRWRLYREPALALALGLALTLFAAWMVYKREAMDRREAFAQLAASRTEAIAVTLRELRDTGLESLAHFYEGSLNVTPEEFSKFTGFLTKNKAVQAWEWIQAVPAAEKNRVEEEARASGLTGFWIWQKDTAGKRLPATGREQYYPVLQVSPMAGNERAPGYDLGSEPLRRAALEEAIRSGLATGTEPITLVQELDSQKGMLIFLPVFASDDPSRLRGFALAVLRMGTLLKTMTSDASALIGISLLHQEGASELLATSWDADTPPDTTLSVTRPVFAFGKVFVVSAHAGPEFLRRHPVRSCWLVGMAGLVLTGALAAVIRLTSQYMDYQKAAQIQCLQQEKMASIGQLAAGVAHEINNPTGFIMSNLGSLRKYAERLTAYIRIQEEAMAGVPADRLETVRKKRKELKIDVVSDDMGKLINESLEGAERITKIVQDLKSFSRADEVEEKLSDLNAGLESTLNIVRNELKYKATIIREYGDIPPIRCRPGQLNQVFMNLLVNAAHAIEKQGEITIKSWEEGGYVKISIADTGCGIPRDKINRIFEPFYTTKEVGKGTGLGLSISYDIVKKHGGEILIESEVGLGTIFTIQLPIRDLLETTSTVA